MRTAALILVFLLGLGLGAAGLRRLASRNESASNGLLEHLAAHGADYDLLVIGPSFVREHFVPPLFERRLRERGHVVSAFGFGITSLRGGEFDYYLRRVLDLPMPRLKWVICDVSIDQTRPLEKRNWYKRRQIQWHAPAQFMFMGRLIMAGGGDLEERLVYVSRHARHALLNLGNVGEGVEALRSGWWTGEERPIPQRGAFVPSVWSQDRLEASRRKYMARGERVHRIHVKRLLKLRAREARKPRPNDIMRGWRDAIRTRGAEPLFLLSPIMTDGRMRLEVPGDEPLRVLDFNDPRRYPELYETEVRYNLHHFNSVGAERFTLAFADAFADMLDGQATEKAAVGRAGASVIAGGRRGAN